MKRVLQNIPRKLLILIPLRDLRKLLTHEQQLLARMAIHKSICGTQICRLFLIGLPRHLAEHGRLSMYDFIVREYQHKILTVGVKHAEGQLPVMLVAEIRITLHVSGKIIHPAHIPLIIKAQAVLLHRAGDLRPCGRFLRDQKSAPDLLFEYAV